MSGGRTIFRKNRLMFLSLVVGLLVAECVDGTQTVHAKLSIAKSKVSLYEGEKISLKVKGKAKKKRMTWRSSNRKVAAVSAKGVVTGKKAGTTKVYASLKGSGKKAYCTVKVGKYAKSMVLESSANVTLRKGATSQIQARVLPKKALERTCTYRSLDASVVTVSARGRMTAIAAGVAKVEVESKGRTRKGKKLARTIQVIVQDDGGGVEVTTSPTVPSPNTSEPSAPSPYVPAHSVKPILPSQTPTPSIDPGRTGEPTATPSITPTTTPTTTPKTLQDMINEITPPGDDQAVAAVFVVYEEGDASTLYFLNKNFSGNVQLSLNGKTFRSSGSMDEALEMMESQYLVMSNTANTVRVSRRRGEGWWTLTDLTIPKEYKAAAWRNDTVYNSPYGLMIVKGDTSDAFQIR